MRLPFRLSISILSLGLFLAVGANASGQDSPLPEARPDSVGFSVERLKRLDQSLQALVDGKQLAGLVTLVARHGQLVQQKTYGQQDIAGAKPMQGDTIFRIYSMTKPITGVAMMILFEEGKWKPSDPISKHIPEFASLKVFCGLDDSGNLKLEAPTHAPTMGELMSHTAGFTYGFFGNTPVDKAYRDAGPFQAASLKEFIDRVAKLPLAYQPGEAWIYSLSGDIEGYLVEKLSGKPFPEFVRERIFAPLGMKDTHFFLPMEKRDRFAAVYGSDADGKAVRQPEGQKGQGHYVDGPRKSFSGGAGLISTARDYATFLEALRNGGALGKVRILSPHAVELMTTNQVGKLRGETANGFGYGFETHDRYGVSGMESVGSWGWGGAYGTYYRVDPEARLTTVFMIQLAPNNTDFKDKFTAAVYQALLQ